MVKVLPLYYMRKRQNIIHLFGEGLLTITNKFRFYKEGNGRNNIESQKTSFLSRN